MVGGGREGREGLQVQILAKPTTSYELIMLVLHLKPIPRLLTTPSYTNMKLVDDIEEWSTLVW